MVIRPSRRELLRLFGVSAGVSAGCLGTGNDDIADVMLASDRTRDSTVTTVVTRLSDDQVVLNETLTLPADGFHEYEDPINSEGKHRFHVSTEDGLENRLEWDVSSDEATGLQITVREESIDFSPVAA
jgi:hypothetical protein